MQFVINGMQVKTDADAGMPLLWFLRDELGLTGRQIRLWGRPVRSLYHPSQWRSCTRMPDHAWRSVKRDDYDH